jgi:CheY-like chemotaxis protein
MVNIFLLTFAYNSCEAIIPYLLHFILQVNLYLCVMGKVILVVDDDADDRELFRDALHETDNSAVYLSAGNGQEALDLFNQPGHIIPDFIFLDLNMPRMDGRQCLIRLRKIPRLEKVPIIIFTTLKPGFEGEEYRQLGANLCVTKPMLYAELKKIIRSIITEEWTTSKMRVNK